MSSVYNTEPPTKGKVVLKTTHGDIDVELWPREAPLACRNFVQLALEGAYDGTPFHRVVADLMVQGGAVAPGHAGGSGDGAEPPPGGVSVYGAPFKDEFHSRLRFTHRGLVACAGGGAGARDANGSQFFITTAPGPLPHLDRVHTIFGRVAGPAIHTVLAIAAVETDGATDAPVGDPPRVTGVDVLWNPFDDVVPRTTAAEREAAAREAAVAADAAARAAAKAAAVRAPQLLSFGGADDDEEEDDDAGAGAPAAAIPRRGMVSAHDVAAGGRLADTTDADAVEAAATARARAVAAAARDGRQDVDDAKVAAFAAKMTAPPTTVAAAAANAATAPTTTAAAAATNAATAPPTATTTSKRGRPSPDGEAAASPSSSPAPPPPAQKYTRGAAHRAAAAAVAASAGGALDAWHARRAAFAARRASGAAARDADTLARLTQFAAKLRSADGGGQGGGASAAAPAPSPAPPTLYSGELRPDADAELPPSWRVAAYLGAAADPSLAALAAHRMVAPRPAGAAAGAADDGLETVDPLAEGRLARGEGERGRRREGGGRRRDDRREGGYGRR